MLCDVLSSASKSRCLALGLFGESVERSVSADHDGEPGDCNQAIMRILQKGKCAVKLSRR